MLSSKILSLIHKFSKKQSVDETFKLLDKLDKKYNFSDFIEVKFHEFGNDDTQDYDHSTKTINLHMDDLFDIITLHELGHAYYSNKVKNSFNYKLSNVKHKDKFPSIWIYNSELEAWKFAEDNLGRPFTLKEKAMKRLALNTYKFLKKGESLADFSKEK